MSGQDDHLLEEFLVETVTEIRERLDAFERLVLAEGFTVEEEGMCPRIAATWMTDHFDAEHDVVHARGGVAALGEHVDGGPQDRFAADVLWLWRSGSTAA